MPNKIDHNLISMLTNIMRRDECGLVDHNIFELVVAIMTSTVQFAYIPMDVRAQCKWHHGDRGVDSVSWTVKEDGEKKYKMEHLVQAKDVHGEVAFRSAATFFSQGLLCGQNVSGNVCLPYMTIVGNEETSLNYVPDHIVSMYPEKMKHSEISMTERNAVIDVADSMDLLLVQDHTRGNLFRFNRKSSNLKIKYQHTHTHTHTNRYDSYPTRI